MVTNFVQQFSQLQIQLHHSFSYTILQRKQTKLFPLWLFSLCHQDSMILLLWSDNPIHGLFLCHPTNLIKPLWAQATLASFTIQYVYTVWHHFTTLQSNLDQAVLGAAIISQVMALVEQWCTEVPVRWFNYSPFNFWVNSHYSTLYWPFHQPQSVFPPLPNLGAQSHATHHSRLQECQPSLITCPLRNNLFWLHFITLLITGSDVSCELSYLKCFKCLFVVALAIVLTGWELFALLCFLLQQT